MAELKAPSSGVEEQAESSDVTSALEAAETDAADAAEAGAGSSGTTSALEAAEAEADAADAGSDAASDAAEDRRPRMGVDGRPEWSPNAHVERGEVSADGKRLIGYHSRPGGVDSGQEAFDESTRSDLPGGCYAGRWSMTDADGNAIKKPNGADLNKFSTFWPDNMSSEDRDAATAEAYDDAVENGTLDAWGFSGVGAGIHVRGWFDAAGKVTTSYPDVNRYEQESADD
jgi:hypothetical protein